MESLVVVPQEKGSLVAVDSKTYPCVMVGMVVVVDSRMVD